MKTLALLLSFLAVAMSSRGATIAQWNFNSAPPDASTTTGSTNASTGGGSLRVVGGTTYTFASGDVSDPATNDNTAINLAAFPTSTASNKTAGIRFAVDTTGYQNITITWAQRCSATASRYYRLQYSTDGINFTDTTNVYAMAAATIFTNFSADLSGLAGAGDDQNFAFQIVSEFESTATGAGASAYVATTPTSTYGTAGTARFEMMTISGTAGSSANNSPTISAITNITMRANTTYPAVPFTISDVETSVDSLVLAKSSSDPLILPESGILINGSGGNQTVTITPAANQSGLAAVTLTVIDGGGKSNSTIFAVNVLPTNTPPTISAILNQGTIVSAPTAPIAFTIGDLDTPASSLSVAAVSSNTTLLQNDGITLGGSGSNRTITLTPTPGQIGHALVTITVSDTVLITNRSFVLSVDPSPGTILHEPFTYPNGPLTTNSGFLWQTIGGGGGTGQLQVVDGTIYVSSDNGEDVSARLRGEPYTPASATNLYYSLRFSAGDLPSTLGDYFAHFKDNGTTFRAKLTIATTNSPLGYYRIGIANGASFSTNAGYAEVPTDFTFDQTNLVVVRYNVGTGISTLWLNPTNESSPSVTASDLIGATNNVTEFAIRESRFIGNLYVDDVRVATSFGEALGQLPEIVTLRIGRLGDSIQIAWPATATGFTLQKRSAFGSDSWRPATEQSSVVGSENVVTLVNPPGTAFYRLSK